MYKRCKKRRVFLGLQTRGSFERRFCFASEYTQH